MAKVKSPEWAFRITADIPLPYIPAEISSQLRPFAGQCLSLVWNRLPSSVRTALEEWWEQ